ncbi:TonB-dependent receptor plug domain-containing protein [Microbulbifer pacificus]|uniref:TonB-dependent receptor plug domain-containing protein n=1 Tax=Microbulbifer pacificus TaxID=407164 RepID=UPI000CF58081|nr:TonB-dependent receptor [Microbulbifer pacificus]
MKKNLLSAAVMAAIAVPAFPVLAQEEATLVEEVVVTGSRIVRQDFDSASPIATIDQDIFKSQNAMTVESVLNSMPQFVPSVTSTSNNPSNGGQANVELRGLGTTRTLVLVDGKRVVPSNATGVVDLNLLPAALIGSTEIITGGASAAYGSDAIAGVVNFKLRELDGVEIDTSWGETAQSDGAQTTVNISAGMPFAEGRGHVMGSIGFADREAVFAGDRDFANVALGYSGGEFVPLGSGTIREGFTSANTSNLASQAAIDAIFAQYGVAAGKVTPGNTLAYNTDGTLFTWITPENGAPELINFRGDVNDPLQPAVAPYSYNFAPVNMLVMPLERTSFFGRASFELTEDTEIYAQAIYGNYTASQALAPTPLSAVTVSADNPFISDDLKAILDSRANPDAPISFGKRMIEAGSRIAESEYDTFQLISGITGSVFNDWTYDAYASFGQVDITESQFGNISRGKFEELTYAADGGASICEGGLNPFGLGSMTQSCVDYITVDSQNNTTVDQTIVEATFSGPVFTMPAGDVYAAFGAFYKKDEYNYTPDSTLSASLPDGRPDIAGFNAQQAVVGETDSQEVYAEVAIPLLANVPGIYSLDLDLGYRYADYSTAGGVNSYKSELKFRPVESLMLRGTMQRAVRAPNISELYTPQQTNFPSIQGLGDPCSVNNAAFRGDKAPNVAGVEQLCTAQGIPAAAMDVFTYTNSQVQGLNGGNPDLQEETADTFSLGLVFTSPLDGIYSDMQLSIDLFNIEIEDAISQISASTSIERCFSAEYNPTFSNDNFFCSQFSRNSSGEIVNAQEVSQNLGGIATRGIDVQYDWTVDAGPGSLNLNWMATYTHSYKVQELPGDAFVEYAGTAGYTIASSFPEWKWNMGLRYDINDISVGARWRFVDAMQDFGVEDFRIPDMHYYDLNASYAFSNGAMEGLSLRAGILNLTDETPHIYPSYVQSNTDPSQYDVLGRQYFVALNYQF